MRVDRSSRVADSITFESSYAAASAYLQAFKRNYANVISAADLPALSALYFVEKQRSYARQRKGLGALASNLFQFAILAAAIAILLVAFLTIARDAVGGGNDGPALFMIGLVLLVAAVAGWAYWRDGDIIARRRLIKRQFLERAEAAGVPPAVLANVVMALATQGNDRLRHGPQRAFAGATGGGDLSISTADAWCGDSSGGDWDGGDGGGDGGC